MKKESKFILILALVVDLLFGDPPNRFHPVAWMGNLIAALKRHAPRRLDSKATSCAGKEFAYGTFLTLLGGSLVAGIGVFVQKLPPALRWIVEVVALKSTFSARGLDRAAREVQSALERGDLPEARRLLRWHLVSRDTTLLSETQVSAAAIESVAENASDGVIAPLFFYTLGGLPAALAYRYVNTADAMLGYRDAAHEWLGKFPARFDDLLNFIPARLTGILVVIAAKWNRIKFRRAWQVMRRDAPTTDSPNAGYPMSAMAGALDVELEKVGQYKLGKGLRQPTPEDIGQARKLLMLVTGLAAVLFFFSAHREK